MALTGAEKPVIRHNVTANVLKLLFLATLMAGQTVYAADGNESSTGRNIKGIQFNVPNDWPIDDRGGSLGPVPVEEYVTMKFEKSDERLDQMESRADTRFNVMGSQVGDMEQKVEDMDERLRDLEQWLKRGEARRLN